MQITERQVGEVVVLALVGRLAHGDLGSLEPAVNTLLNAGRRKIVLDLTEVPYIGPEGFNEIVSCFSSASRQGGGLKLANAQDNVERTMKASGLIAVLALFDDLDDAVQSYAA